MIENVASKIAQHLCETNVIEKENEELYAYGFFMLLSRLLFFSIATAFGLVFGVVIESILFFVFFFFIREFAGGIHASTELKCTLCTTLSFFLCIAGIRYLSQYFTDYFFYCLLFIFVLLILIFAPLDSPEKPLDDKEKKRFKRIASITTMAVALISGVLYCLNLERFAVSGIFALALSNVLLISGKIKYAFTNR